MLNNSNDNKLAFNDSSSFQGNNTDLCKDSTLHVIFKSSVPLFNAFWFKDQLPKCLNSMLPYKFRCNSCDSVYIGKARR